MNPQQFNFLGNNTLQNFQNNTGGMINQTSNESEKFPGLTKQQETEIMNKANQANVTESQKNYMLNDMYQQQLRRNQIDKFAEERENTKRQLIRRAVESKDIKTSKQSKQIEKKGDVADMIRKYVSATQEIDLNKLNKVPDDQIIADFTADNPDVAYAIDDFTKSQMSSQYFSEMMGFSQFEEQQDEGFFKNLLNSITYGVETGAKGLKGLIDKGLDTVEGNSNESSISMENLTAFDNYIQHKYGVSGSQLRESDKEVWQQERNLVQDNPEVLKQYMTTASEDALNFAEGYTDALFTATNPYMALGMKTVGAAEQEMGGGVLTWLAEKMGGVGEIINSIPGLSNYRDTLSPEDQQRFDAFVGNVAVGLILGTKNKKNIIKDPKTFLMENLQPNQITKNFVQSMTGMPDKFFGGADSLAGGTKGLMSKAAKGVDNAGNLLDKGAERGAKKITGTTSAQDKLYKAQEPRMNILSEKKNLEKRRSNSDRANELILENGYKPTNTSERLDAHQKTLNKLWGEVMEKVNKKEGVVVDQTPMIEALSNYIKEKKKLGVAGIESDIKALEAELKALKKMQAEGNTDVPILENKKQIYNDLIDRKGQEASEVYKGGIKLLTNEIGKIEDAIISEIPGEFSSLKRDVGALLDSYEDVFKADMKNQRKKGLGLTETYSRLEGVGDTLGGIVKLFGGDASGVVKGLGKIALGKALAKATDVDFLIKQGFEDLYNEKLGGNKSQASSKTAKYQTVYHGSLADFDRFDSSHMGEGEGNQAHGWGHYVAVDKNTAKLNYAEMNKERKYTYNGKTSKQLINQKSRTLREDVISDVLFDVSYQNAKYPTIDDAINHVKGMYESRLENLEKEDFSAQYKAKHRKNLNAKLEELKTVKDDIKQEFGSHLYDVDIPDPVKKNTPTGKNYLEEDYTLNEKEANKMADAIDKYAEKNKGNFEYQDPMGEWRLNRGEIDRDTLNNYTYENLKREADTLRTAGMVRGKILVQNLQNSLGDKGASKLLEDMGYDGIHYFGGNDGEAYVIFNDDALKITNHQKYQKYGVADANSKNISANKGLDIENFKNGRTVKQIADHYGVDTNIVEKILTPEGEKALGMYDKGIITLAETIKESTAPHELLHATFDMVDSVRKAEILDGIKKRLKVDDIQAEEWLADRFSDYYRTGSFDTKGIPTTFAGKVRQFFKQIKEFVDGTYANRKQIQNLFDDILDKKDLGGNSGGKKVFQSAGDIYGNNFKNRFGDRENDPNDSSKVVDKNGEPLEVYHGTPENFTEFRKDMIGTNYGQDSQGFFFTDNKATAEDYANTTSYGMPRSEKGNVMSVYLDIKNPLIERVDYDPINLWDNNYEKLLKKANDNGNDGIIIKADKGENLYIPFEPEQIKSATDNVGTYDVNNPDIRYQTMSDAEMRKWQGKGLKKIGNGDNGPIYSGLKGNQAVAFLLGEKRGEVKGALDMGGEAVDLIWGGYNGATQRGLGLKKILEKHPEALWKIQEMIDERINNKQYKSDRVELRDDKGVVVIRLDRDGKDKKWLMTAYDK